MPFLSGGGGGGGEGVPFGGLLASTCKALYSSISFTWDRETIIKAQGLLANLKTFGFIFTFLILKNSLETLKPIAAKLQQKDQDVFQAYSMIDDTIKAVHRVRSNRRGIHEWFDDSFRLADKIGARVSAPRITDWEART